MTVLETRNEGRGVNAVNTAVVRSIAIIHVFQKAVT